MSFIKYIIINVVCTLLRGFPFPTKTGLIKIGNPDENSPVFLTCNYKLTVERVKKALKNINCYLLVANSRGINVWCAATGGLFTNHDVISVIKTSRIEKLVNHRNVIFPQLAAPGIELKVIQKEIGWRIIWGPVYAKNLPQFFKDKLKKTTQMRMVKFPLLQRIEMAIMWAFPFSVVVFLVMFLFWKKSVFPVITLIWVLSLLVFVLFPVYVKWLNVNKKRIGFSKYTVIFDFSRLPLILWVLFIGFFIVYNFSVGRLNLTYILKWGFISMVIIFIISIDLMGSTPVYKSGLHEDRFLKIVLDEKKCRGAGFCENVCPMNCYEVSKKNRIATLPRINKCVQCGACIVQCPFDALCFKSPDGKLLMPSTIRKFKLNLIGKRLVKAQKQ